MKRAQMTFIRSITQIKTINNHLCFVPLSGKCTRKHDRNATEGQIGKDMIVQNLYGTSVTRTYLNQEQLYSTKK